MRMIEKEKMREIIGKITREIAKGTTKEKIKENGEIKETTKIEEKEKEEKIKEEKKKIEYKDIWVDKAKLYINSPIQINDWITITQPTVGDIIDFGEANFYSTVYMLVANTTMYRVPLWKMGIDWNKISDMELFAFFVEQKQIDMEVTKFLLPDVNFNDFGLYKNQEGEMYLKSIKDDRTIDEELYLILVKYLREIFHIYPKIEKARGKATKEAIIEDDLIYIEAREKDKDKDKNESVLLPYLSGCVNHPGFKYSSQEVKKIGIYEFMDSVQRLQVYETTTALLKGRFSGFIDTSEIADKEFNFMRPL